LFCLVVAPQKPPSQKHLSLSRPTTPSAQMTRQQPVSGSSIFFIMQDSVLNESTLQKIWHIKQHL